MLQMTKVNKSQEFLQFVANQIKLRMLKIPEDDVLEEKEKHLRSQSHNETEVWNILRNFCFYIY